MKQRILLLVTWWVLSLPVLRAFPEIDTSDRWQVRDFYNTVFPFGSNTSMDWTGNYDSGNAGTISADWLEATRVRVNFFRAMAGVPANVTFDATLNAKSQDAALIMSANKALSHFPPPDWSFYTADGREAAENGNLALGSAGPDAIEGYMIDFGGNNTAVGHRRWILYPQTSVMGSGDVPGIDKTDIFAANTLYVITDEFFNPRPTTREEFVAWPPAGMVPSNLVYARWSFSLPGASFNGATVTMERDGQEIDVALETVAPNIGEPTIVWIADNMDTSQRVLWPTPVTDETVTVTIENVTVSGQSRNFQYEVTIFDAAKAGIEEYPSEAVAFEPVIAGHPAWFHTTARPWSEGVSWRVLETSPFAGTLDAEGGQQPFEANTSGGYSIIQSGRTASGSGAFHLVHPEPEAQTLTLPDEFLAADANASLSFDSSLGTSSEFQFAIVEIRTSQDGAWQEIWRKSGPVSSNSSFEEIHLALEDFKGKAIRIRFRYDLDFGNYYAQTSSSFGWAFDNVELPGLERLDAIASTGEAAGTTAFGHVFDTTGRQYLQTRDHAFDGFALEWGPASEIAPIAASSILSAGSGWETDPVFVQAREVGAGWHYTANVAWVLRDHFPWLYTGAGWMYYVAGNAEDGLWLHSPVEGFVFTRLAYGNRYLKAPFDGSSWGSFRP